MPRDTIQAAALLRLMKADGCKNVALANDKDTYGAGLARLIQIQAGKKQASTCWVTRASTRRRRTTARWPPSSRARRPTASCSLASPPTARSSSTRTSTRRCPNAKLYGGDGVCESGLTNPSKKGIPAAVGKHFQCTVATQNLASYPGGKKFLAAYKAKYHDAHPDPYAIYGYEAGSLFIDTLKKLGAKATDKGAVLKALFATKNRKSVLGTYSFDKNGDTTSTAYGIYKVGSDGNPTFEKGLK